MVILRKTMVSHLFTWSHTNCLETQQITLINTWGKQPRMLRRSSSKNMRSSRLIPHHKYDEQTSGQRPLQSKQPEKSSFQFPLFSSLLLCVVLFNFFLKHIRQALLAPPSPPTVRPARLPSAQSRLIHRPA